MSSKLHRFWCKWLFIRSQPGCFSPTSRCVVWVWMKSRLIRLNRTDSIRILIRTFYISKDLNSNLNSLRFEISPQNPSRILIRLFHLWASPIHPISNSLPIIPSFLPFFPLRPDHLSTTSIENSIPISGDPDNALFSFSFPFSSSSSFLNDVIAVCAHHRHRCQKNQKMEDNGNLNFWNVRNEKGERNEK